MTNEQTRIKFFMTIAGQLQQGSNKPNVPDVKIRQFRKRIIDEEINTELLPAIESGDIEQVADGIGDSMYVLLGTALNFGLDMEPIFSEIHKSNMSKFQRVNGKLSCIKREDGKVIKPVTFFPPNILLELEKQGYKI